MHLPEVLAILTIIAFGLEIVASGLLSVLRLIPEVRDLCDLHSDDKVVADRYRAAHSVIVVSIALWGCLTVGFGIFNPLLSEIFEKTKPVPTVGFLDPYITALALAAGSGGLSALRKKVGDAPPEGTDEEGTDTGDEEGGVSAHAKFEPSPTSDVEGEREESAGAGG